MRGFTVAHPLRIDEVNGAQKRTSALTPSLPAYACENGDNYGRR